MEMHIDEAVAAPQRHGGPKSWIIALALGATLALAGAASVFAASPSADASASPASTTDDSGGTTTDDGSDAHVCPDQTDSDSATDTSSSS